MGLFARGCVSPVLISGGQQPSQRVPASFRRPAEPRNGTEYRWSVPLGRAPFWTFARRSGTVPWEGRQTCDGCDDRIPGTYIRRAANRRPLHRSPEPIPVRSGRCCLRGCQSLPLVQRSPADERERTRTWNCTGGVRSWYASSCKDIATNAARKRLLVRPRTSAVSSARSRASTKATPKRPPARCRLWVWAARGAVTTACIRSMPR